MQKTSCPLTYSPGTKNRLSESVNLNNVSKGDDYYYGGMDNVPPGTCIVGNCYQVCVSSLDFPFLQDSIPSHKFQVVDAELLTT